MLSEIKLILSIYVELYLKGNIIVILYYINRLHKRASFSNEDFFFPRPEYDIDFIMQRNIAVFWMMKTNIKVWFSKILPKYGGFVFFNKKCLELILTLLNIIAGNKIGLKLLRLEPFYFYFTDGYHKLYCFNFTSVHLYLSV